MMQGVGYGLGSTGTLMVGQLHQSTGSFAAAGRAVPRGGLARRGVRLPGRAEPLHRRLTLLCKNTMRYQLLLS